VYGVSAGPPYGTSTERSDWTAPLFQMSGRIVLAAVEATWIS
jgi:hypothetical protein